MKEIGGYFELELPKSSEYHDGLIKLNSGRNSFKYILKTRKPKKVFIPNYICDSVIEPLEELNINYEFYNIDKNFEIVQDIQLEENELIFYVNYFALKSKYINVLSKKYKKNLIIDNTQAFFEKPLSNIDTIYSARKFFGVSDGAYLSTTEKLNEIFVQDKSYEYSIHLLGRIDNNASSFYADYLKAEHKLINQPIKHMSNLTQNILSSIDYKSVLRKRKDNFKYLDVELKDINSFNMDNNLDFVPFTYLFMINDGRLREKLIENKIYIAKYWTEVLERKTSSTIEKELVNHILPLPIDQRYEIEDMQMIVKVIKDNV